MANAGHLDRLRQGVDKWNQWREENLNVEPDLSRANLSGAKLINTNLRGANLCESNLRESNLHGADLSGANLRKSNLHGANLSEVALGGANLHGANLSGVDLREVDLRGVDLHKVALGGANLSGANLHEANLIKADLGLTNLIKADLSEADLSEAKLMRTNLSRANLHGANLKLTELFSSDLSRANLSGVNLSKANLSEAELVRANLSGANLHEASLLSSDLSRANLSEANLSRANLSRADLSEVELGGADLSGVNFRRTQVFGTNFERAILTGACLEDWNINSATNFEGVICEYVYLQSNQQERRPREGIFKPGEFTTLFQQAIDTVDLIFKDGIDWQAFFQSFQDLRSQYADQDLSIQAIEKKRGGSFVVRLEVAEDADKGAIESSAKELYETKLVLLEQRYRAELQAKDGEIVAYREQSANLMKITEMLAARPPMSEGNKYDLRGAQFGGGYVAGNVEGNQYGGTINNYGSNAEDITRLLTALRDQAQIFPSDQKDDANDVLDDLERDLAEEQPDQGRIGRRLKKLVALGAAIGTIASGAAAVSGDVSTFTGNVIELTEQLGIPVEQVQLPPSGTP